MSIKNHPGTPTEESTEAKRFADANSTTPLVNDTTVPMFDQLVRQEVKTFLGTVDQSAYGPEDAGSALLDQ